MRGLSGHIKGLLSSTKVKTRPKQLRAWVRTYHPEICLDGVISEKLKAQLTTLHETASKKSSQQLMEPGQRGRRATLLSTPLYYAHSTDAWSRCLGMAALSQCCKSSSGPTSSKGPLQRTHVLRARLGSHCGRDRACHGCHLDGEPAAQRLQVPHSHPHPHPHPPRTRVVCSEHVECAVRM